MSVALLSLAASLSRTPRVLPRLPKRCLILGYRYVVSSASVRGVRFGRRHHQAPHSRRGYNCSHRRGLVAGVDPSDAVSPVPYLQRGGPPIRSLVHLGSQAVSPLRRQRTAPALLRHRDLRPYPDPRRATGFHGPVSRQPAPELTLAWTALCPFQLAGAVGAGHIRSGRYSSR